MATNLKNDHKKWIQVCVLGSGAFGIVELWKNEYTQENIAIKKSQARLDKSNDKKWTRWVHEVEIMNQLNHLNIVGTKKVPEQLVDSGNGLPVLCMEYCTKGDLRNVLNNCDNFSGLKPEDALNVMQDISSAVEYLHSKKITHRDLKPENIVMQEIRNKIIYKLIDLGYAKTLGDQSISASIVGTLNYVAPELLWKDTYSCSVDYWSLGILFYEILTGSRPFLPNMQLTQTWMKHVKSKKYEDISAREINDKIVFNTDFEDPHSIPKCIKNDLVQWFQVVFQWDPKKRGKLPNEPDQLVVFSMLKSIFSKKIITALMVSKYKYESFVIDTNFTVIKFKQLIYEKENIDLENQILTNSEGNLLDDNFFSTSKSLEIVLIFNCNQICIEKNPPPVFSKPINEMITQPRKKFDYFHLRRYYGATTFFMKQELELYRSYILALSIMIDLCDEKFRFLRNDINELSSSVELLSKKVESISEIKSQNDELDDRLSHFEELKKNINKLLEGTKRVNEKLNNIAQKNDKFKAFSDVDWMEDLLEHYDTALKLIKKWQIGDHNQRQEPLAMVNLFFKFSESFQSIQRLKNGQLIEFGRNITQFLRHIKILKEVLKSFTALLNSYLHDVNILHQSIHDSCKNVENHSNHNLNVFNSTNSSQNTSDSTNAVVYHSIFMRNMFEGLLVEMDMWKRKYADLNYFDGS